MSKQNRHDSPERAIALDLKLGFVLPENEPGIPATLCRNNERRREASFSPSSALSRGGQRGDQTPPQSLLTPPRSHEGPCAAERQDVGQHTTAGGHTGPGTSGCNGGSGLSTKNRRRASSRKENRPPHPQPRAAWRRIFDWPAAILYGLQQTGCGGHRALWNLTHVAFGLWGPRCLSPLSYLELL